MFKKSVYALFIFSVSILYSQSRFEISFHIGYSNPLLESHGNNLVVDSSGRFIFIEGKRLLVSDNLAANVGYNVTSFLKYSLTENGRVKGLFSLGYNNLFGSYSEIFGYNPGVRIQTFSAGLGAEINPLGQKNNFYPSVFGLFRLNFIGGESYIAAGLDIFKVTSRFGYLTGLNLNYRIKKTVGMYFGYSYSYDNLLNKQTEETYQKDPHVIPFRDKASSTNGLTADRRIAYWSLYLGMNFYFK
jgi:hypothetical protein